MPLRYLVRPLIEAVGMAGQDESVDLARPASLSSDLSVLGATMWIMGWV